MKEFILEWLIYLQKIKKVSPHTQAAYEQDIADCFHFFQTHFGEEGWHFSKLTLRDFRAWLAYRYKKKISARSTARAISALKQFYRYLKKYHDIDLPAIHQLRSPRNSSPLPRPLSQKESMDLTDNIAKISTLPWVQKRDQALFTLIYSAGLRLFEALQIRLKDIHEDFFTVTGKGNKQRIVPLLNEVKHMLHEYVALCPIPLKHQGLLFYGVKGRVLNPGVVQRQMRLYRGRAGLPDSATPHALRHSCATHLLAHSQDLRSVQELLGHSSLSTTQVYTDVEVNKLQEIYHKAHPLGNKKE